MKETKRRFDQLDLFEPDPPPDLYPTGFLDPVGNPPRLESVTIDGLKAFDETTVVLPELAVLTGPNNSGKSTVLQAIALGYECLRRCVDIRRWKLAGQGALSLSSNFCQSMIQETYGIGGFGSHPKIRNGWSASGFILTEVEG